MEEIEESVCKACFPAEIVKNCTLHPGTETVDVEWDPKQYRYRIYQIRPVPDKHIKGRFILCYRDYLCRGERCTYAHTEAEQREWNAHIRGGRHSSRRKSDPVPRSCEPFQQKRISSVPPEGPLKQHASAVILPVPILETPEEILTLRNYKSRFNKMIDSEIKEHSRILKSYDGQYKLIVEKFNPRYKSRLIFLDDISEDKIAYVTQASSGLRFSLSDSHLVDGTIMSRNFRHTEKKLYIEIRSNLFRKEYHEEYVLVNFLIKDNYFNALQSFIKSLSNDTISRLLPCNVSEFQEKSLDDCFERLNLQKCSEDQCKALAKIISCPNGGNPLIVTGPFGTGKTYILSLAAHYFLHNITTTTTILVCTQQHTSADAFLHCFLSLFISTPKNALIARVKRDTRDDTDKKGGGRGHQMSYDEFEQYYQDFPPTNRRPYLIVSTCQGAHHLKKYILKEFYFTHIFIDEVGHMREAEAIAPLCMANNLTQIVLAGDKYQVGPELLVLGESSRKQGFNISLLVRLEMAYNKLGGGKYIARLGTNYRCHHDILHLPEKLFYKYPLKSVVPRESTHSDAQFPLVFVCSDISEPKSSENPINEEEAKVVIEQLGKYIKGWPKDYWGMKPEPDQICIMSPSRTQLNRVYQMLRKHDVPDNLTQVELRPSYDMQGREFRMLILSTYEATNPDGSTRNPTKSIMDPYVINTAISRARSLIVSVGNPYLLLNIEKCMCKKYGEKGKYWSNYIKSCIEKSSFIFHKSSGVFDAEKHKELTRLTKLVKKQIDCRYIVEESFGFNADWVVFSVTSDMSSFVVCHGN